MREIKFRQPVWNQADGYDKGTFAYFHYWGFIRGFIAPITGHKDMGEIQKESQQFTDLKDKNGNEIYEGDVLNSKHDKVSPTGGYISSTYGFHPENAQVVSFINGEFVLNGSKNLHAELSFTEKYGGLEVIGNIYENKELLNEG